MAPALVSPSHRSGVNLKLYYPAHVRLPQVAATGTLRDDHPPEPDRTHCGRKPRLFADRWTLFIPTVISGVVNGGTTSKGRTQQVPRSGLTSQYFFAVHICQVPTGRDAGVSRTPGYGMPRNGGEIIALTAGTVRPEELTSRIVARHCATLISRKSTGTPEHQSPLRSSTAAIPLGSSVG